MWQHLQKHPLPSSEQLGNSFVAYAYFVCSALLKAPVFIFKLLFLFNDCAQISEGEVFSLSTLCFRVFCFLLTFVNLCLSHTGQLSSLYRACVSPHTCPSDHCDQQCASYALNKNESIKNDYVMYWFILTGRLMFVSEHWRLASMWPS